MAAAQPERHFVPGAWRDSHARFLEARPDFDPRDKDMIRQSVIAIREDLATPDVFPAEISRHSYDCLPLLRHQTESLAIVMLCAPEDRDIKEEAAVHARAMLGEIDWSRVGDARDWECLDLGCWLGVDAGILPR